MRLREASPLWRKGRRGAVLIQFAISLIAILGVVVFTLDGGLQMDRRRQAQTAADTAALAAADILFKNYVTYQGTDPKGQAKQAALSVAAANGFANDGTVTTVTVNIPPLSGPNLGQLGYAEVLVQYHQTAIFGVIYGANSYTINARAVAVGQWAPLNIGILVLDPTSSGSLSSGGGGMATVTAKVIVDSNSASAAVTTGGSSITAPEFDITGGYSGTGLNGTIKTGQTPTPDPLRFLPEPDPSTMPIQSTKKLMINSPTVLQPGVYQGGISVTGQGGITMAPGIYYMDGGGLSFTGQGSMYASGVMIYNNPHSSNDSISIQGSAQGSVLLTPPTSGIYQGMGLFQERGSSPTMSVSGNGNFYIQGTFYAASALLKIAGNSPGNVIGSQYISYDLTFSGNGGETIKWDAGKIAPIRNIGLVE